MRRLAPLLLLGMCAAKRQQPVTWWEAHAPSTLHPLYAASTLDLRAQAPIYDRLVERSGEKWTSALATSFEVDGGTVTFHLRKDVRWHDGEKLDATDVCATVAALRSKDARTPLGTRLGHRLQHCAVHPGDDSTAVIRLATTGGPDPLEALAFPVLPEHLGDLTDPAGPLATSPVGTGPWRGRANELGVTYTPALTPHHPGDRPPMRLFAVPESDKDREAELPRVDGWSVLPAAEVPAFRGRDGWNLHPYPLGTVIGVALDITEPPLSDPAERAALDRALDRKKLCAELVGTWPDARPAPCRPTMSPFLLETEGTNHGIPLPEPTSIETERPHVLVVALPAELDLPPQAVATALGAAWAPHTVQAEIVPLAELLALDPTERRARFAAVVEARIPADTDLVPWVAVDGGRNWFATADPALLEVVHASEPDDLRVLHAVFSDERVWLPLVELSAMSAWRAAIAPAWMTPVDGLGTMGAWGFNPGAGPGPRPPRSDGPGSP